MRLKVKLGFILIGVVLCLAGVTSYFELARLTTSVQLVIDKGAESISLSKGVLDILQEQNGRVLRYYSDNKAFPLNPISNSDIMVMDSLYIQALRSYPKSLELEAIAEAKKAYIDIFNNKIDTSSTESMSKWYVHDYNVVYNNFTNAVKSFMISSQHYVVSQTDHLKSNIYRTTMQSVVALTVSILILFVFFLLIDVYFIRPVTSITKSLERYLENGISFNVKVEGDSEPAKLRELIIQLIQKNKSAN